MATDVRGITINVNDQVAIGSDNGSTLLYGVVEKITPKKVFCKIGPNSLTYVRDHSRVVILSNIK